MAEPTPITIKASNLELNDALRTYLNRRLAKIEKFIDYNDTTAIADVEIGKEVGDQRSGTIFFAEINLQIGGTILRSVCKKDDIRAAIDCMQSEIIRDIQKHRGKQETLYRRGARRLKEFIHGSRREE